MDGLVTIYNDLGNDITLSIYLYSRIKKEGLGRQDVKELIESKEELKFLEKRVEMYNEHIKGQKERIRQLDHILSNLESTEENYNEMHLT